MAYFTPPLIAFSPAVRSILLFSPRCSFRGLRARCFSFSRVRVGRRVPPSILDRWSLTFGPSEDSAEWRYVDVCTTLVEAY